jgi:class 3 adenylate cyclase
VIIKEVRGSEVDRMRSDHTMYNVKDSSERIAKILTSESRYEERDSIPAFKELSYTNGFNAKCSSICVSVRNLPQLTDFSKSQEHTKLYRAYVSEVTAVMNGNPKCAEINLSGDCVRGVFDTPLSEDLDEVFSTTGRISSVIDLINYKLKKNNLSEITVGIGIAYGKAVVIKAGYKGSSINEVIWSGEALEEASRLASFGNKDSTDKETMVSESVYYNLNSDNQKILSFNSARNCYHGDPVNVYMNRWFKQYCL